MHSSTAPQSSTTPVQTPTPRDIQRAALRDLLSLSQECVAFEAELEARHQAAIIDSQSKFERHHRDYEYRVEALRRQVEEKVVERHALTKQQSDDETKKLSSQVRQRKTKLAADYDAVRSDVKSRYDQAVWLADSVLEAAEVQANQELRKDLERHTDLGDQLNASEADAAKLVQNYGVLAEPADKPTIDITEIASSADDTLQEQRTQVETLLNKLTSLFLPKLFVGIWPWFIGFLLVAGSVAYVQFKLHSTLEPQWHDLGIYAGSVVGGALVLAIILKILALRQVRSVYLPVRTALANSRVASLAVHQNAIKARDKAIQEATARREVEVKGHRDQLEPIRIKAQQSRDASLQALDAESQKILSRIDSTRKSQLAETDSWKESQLSELNDKLADEQKRLKERFDKDVTDMMEGYQQRRTQLQQRWHDGLTSIQAPMGESSPNTSGHTDWKAAIGSNWIPPKTFPPTLAFGNFAVDLAKISAGIPRDGSFELALPDQFSVPAILAFPSQASLLIQTEPEGREEGLRALQMLMVKVLTGIPAGRAKFTILDPVGLGQSFAGFMHLADHDDSLVTGRIWTTPEQIEQRLKDLTEHMETVIQKYLRNEFETIDDYNEQAGELAEPYRFLIIADFPNGFEGDSWRRLLSIARTGSRCGVYTLILRDSRQEMPGDMHLEDLESTSANLVRDNGKFVYRDDIFQQFPLTLDQPPDEETLTRIVNRVGEAAREAKRVEIDFDSIAPKKEQFWTMSAADEISVPVGRMGATRLQYFRCGKGVAQHALVAGKTGSGKSTLLHAMITNLAMWYSPDEVEFYLIDFKKGVEFKTYADYQLQHARAIAVESDREFGLSVLQRIDAELTRRGELYRKAGVQDLSSYRGTPDALVMPRVMLVIDEFQEFFIEDDKLAQDSQLLLDRLVRQGRAFGIHVFLGSQTIGGSASLARTTIGQMAIRIALQCSEADSQLILGDNNAAARLLSRPGEAIYNDAGGAVENNSPFQVAWLADSRREQYLAQVQDLLKTRGIKRLADPPIVFEGNAPADVTKNPRLNSLLDKAPETAINYPVIWVGDPVAIKDPTSIILRKQSGSNVLVMGQQEEQSLAILSLSVISLAAQQRKDKASFYLFDGAATDSSLFGKLEQIAKCVPNNIHNIDYRSVDEAINELSEELKRRTADDSQSYSAIYIVIYGLQRYRMLRKSDDEFSFSVSDEPKKASASKQFLELLREGPNVGIHFIVWCDTLASIERTLERGTMREFDNRILFQMSANDSSNLIDSPVANKLGFFRAISYSEEQGVMEKFRPYGLPTPTWLETVTKALRE